MKIPSLETVYVYPLDDILYALWSGQNISNFDIQQWMRAELPYTMHPTILINIATLPLNTNGKPDVDAIVALIHKHLLTDSPPKSFKEIWKKGLGVESVNPQQDFFDAGGDSLKAIALISQLSKINLNLTLADLYTLKTFSQVQHFLEEPPPS